MEPIIKKHISVLRMKMHGLMILVVWYSFSLGKKSFVFNRVNKQKTDEVGRILIRDITLDADQYIQINLYNGNTETEEVKIFDELQSLKKFRYHSKQIYYLRR